jgi:hypothetical protein
MKLTTWFRSILRTFARLPSSLEDINLLSTSTAEEREAKARFNLSRLEDDSHFSDREPPATAADALHQILELQSLIHLALMAENPNSVIRYSEGCLVIASDWYSREPRAMEEAWNSAVFLSHQALGQAALWSGKIESAERHLIESISFSRPPDEVRSFGPSMSLARNLLAVGRREVVSSYLRACGRFWDPATLKIWADEIEVGNMPVLRTPGDLRP